jgi:hypothetical protein
MFRRLLGRFVPGEGSVRARLRTGLDTRREEECE